jgi:hypothetical protein
MTNLNLDALIPREDFAVLTTANTQNQFCQTIKTTDLAKDSFFYNALRKPDFQRETSNWAYDKCFNFIETFLSNDLIPSIILWNAGSYTFVIDGAHRLSALIAWVNDDYGDGFISQAFYNHEIPSAQRKNAEKCRKLIRDKIGDYNTYKESIANQNKADPEKLKKARLLGTLSMQIQWVNGDIVKAESAFFKINQNATPIDTTEISILKARKYANAIAARAITHSGNTQTYLSHFSDDTQNKIKSIAKEIYELLFLPEICNVIKSLDLPIAGKYYSKDVLSLIFNLINIIDNEYSKKEDEDGELTLKILFKTKKIIDRFTGLSKGSLGLHPIVYCYSLDGKFQISSFFATIELIKYLDKNNQYSDFTKIRGKFEQFLIDHKYMINQITVKYGSGLKSYLHIEEVFLFIIEKLQENCTNEQICDSIQATYKYINFDNANDSSDSLNQDFSSSSKSKIFITDSIKKILRCTICNGFLHKNSISFDHITKKQDGGLGNPENGQLTHPYCNSTIKK